MPALPIIPADVEVQGVTFSPAGGRLAASAGRCVVIADAAGGNARTIELPVRGKEDVAYALAFSPRGDRLAVVYKTAGVFVLDVETGATVARIGTRVGHSSVVWSPDCRYLVAGQFEPFITIFDIAKAKRLYVLSPDIFDDEGNTVVTFVDDTLVSTAGIKICLWPFATIMGGTVKVKDMADTLGMVPAVKPTKIGRSGYGHVVDIAVSQDRTRVVALETTETEWNLLQLALPAGDNLARAIKLPRFANHVVWTADPDVVAISEPCAGGVVLWNLATRRPVARTFDGAGADTAQVLALASDSSGTRLAAATDHGLWLWGVATGRAM